MRKVAVLGAGTMGAGIAQTAAQGGWEVALRDVDEASVEAAIAGIRKRLDRLVEKDRLTPEARDAAAARLLNGMRPDAVTGAELVIEAIFENLDAKVRAIREIAASAAPEATLATNTSSLSVAEIGAGVSAPERMVGMHFFNPVPLMKLVEIIRTDQTDPRRAARAAEIATAWGKTVVRVRDTPGFIVNRVARGYYLEAMRLLGEGVAGVDEIDQVMRTMGGFRMGPFELMDLIGIDVNYTVSVSVWEQLGRPPRLEPHPLQRQLFDNQQFGRKSGRGAYRYDAEPPVPALPLDRKSFDLPASTYEAVRLFADGAGAVGGSITEQYILARILAAIINEAGLALDEDVASAADIDTAMTLGVNYPHGPTEWAERIGRRTCRHLLDALNSGAGAGRYAPAKWLRE